MIAPFPLTGEKAYVSAWLDNSRTDVEKIFRCNTCGTGLFKYYDSLQLVVPGRFDNGENPFIIRCSGVYEFRTPMGRMVSPPCKTNYWIYR